MGLTYPIWYWLWCAYTDLTAGRPTAYGIWSILLIYPCSILSLIGTLIIPFPLTTVERIALMVPVYLLGYVGYRIERYQQTRVVLVNYFLEDLGEFIALTCNAALFGLAWPFVQPLFHAL